MKVRSHADGRVFEGRDASEVVTKMRDVEPRNRALDLPTYMQHVATWMGEDLDVSSAERFLASLIARGYVTHD
ncbi:MAG: hypothetical protein AAB426_04490 [Myxococcota bacterium]